MPPKRRRNASLPPKGLQPGEQLNRNALPSSSSLSPWAWVGNIVADTADITLEHRLASCNLSWKNPGFCPNKYSAGNPKANGNSLHASVQAPSAAGELQDDIIVISDDDEPSCSKKKCKANPNCLNYLGQQAWQDDGQPNLSNFLFSLTDVHKMAPLGTLS
jgi:hypothetical protein